MAQAGGMVRGGGGVTSLSMSGSGGGGGGGGEMSKHSPIPNSPPPRYDEVPRDDDDNSFFHQPGSVALPLYDDVPVEAKWSQQTYSKTAVSSGAKYGNLPQTYISSKAAYDSSAVSANAVAPSYQACGSEFSDDYDDDEFDDEFDEPTMDPPPPPLPPKDYSGEWRGGRDRDRGDKPYILPVVQDGRQLSHTHYFLIPPKYSSAPPTAAVKPFVSGERERGGVGNEGVEDLEDEGTHVDYQNIDVAASHLSLSHKGKAGKSSSSSSTKNGQLPSLKHKSEQRSASLHTRHSHSSSASKVKGRSHHSSHHSSSSSATHRTSLSSSSHRTYNNRDYGDDTYDDYKDYSYGGGGTANGDDNGFGEMSPRERVVAVQSEVMGVTDEECHTALLHCHWRVPEAVKYLKVEQLFRLGVAPRTQCRRLLEALQWNLELASSVLLDQARNPVQCESAV
jgi:hypothetical protein